MKKSISNVLTICIVIFIVLFASALPLSAAGHIDVRGGFVIGPGPGPRPWIGPGWGPWIGPGWWGPWWGSPAYPYYDYDRQPPVFDQQIQQPEEQYYWYYCAESKTYYPYVKQCPKGWMKVLPTPPAPTK